MSTLEGYGMSTVSWQGKCPSCGHSSCMSDKQQRIFSLFHDHDHHLCYNSRNGRTNFLKSTIVTKASCFVIQLCRRVRLPFDARHVCDGYSTGVRSTFLSAIWCRKRSFSPESRLLIFFSSTCGLAWLVQRSSVFGCVSVGSILACIRFSWVKTWLSKGLTFEDCLENSLGSRLLIDRDRCRSSALHLRNVIYRFIRGQLNWPIFAWRYNYKNVLVLSFR